MERRPSELRLKSLEQEFEQWKPMLKDLQKYVVPIRGFFDEMPNSGRKPDYQAVIDGTPSRSLRILAAGMTSGLTSPSRPWFKLDAPDPGLQKFAPVRNWLDDVETRMLSVFSRSNVYGELHTHYAEVGGFGTGATIVLEDYRTVIRARTFTAGEYFVSVGSDGRVNGIGRKYYMTVGQLVKAFGQRACSEHVQSMFKNDQVDKWIRVCHLIESNDGRIPGKADFMNMEYCSKYWEESSPQDTYLKIGGFEDFPAMVSRWDLTTALDSYGKGPGWEALGDIRMLQQMQSDKLVGLDKLMNPPMQADASVPGPVNSLPGGVTRTTANSPNAGVRPAYQIDPRIEAVDKSILSTQRAIREAFYADLFLTMLESDRRQMTAREVVERHEEKLLMLGPVLERLESDLLDPLITRVFNIMLRSRLPNGEPMIPPPPQELQGMDLEVRYISLLAQAQKMVGTSAIEQFSRFVGEIAAVKPEVLDVYDETEAAIEYGDILGVPPRIVRSMDQVGEIRKSRAKAQAEQAKMQTAAAMVQGANTLSKTPVGENSALDALLGTTGAAEGAE